MLPFLRSLSYGRVRNVRTSQPMDITLYTTDTDRHAISVAEYLKLGHGARERQCTVEAPHFEGWARVRGVTVHFESRDACELVDSLDALTKTGKRLLPRPSRLCTQLVERDGVFEEGSTLHRFNGELIFGVLDGDRFVQWFAASEQFLRFYRLVLNGPTPYNKLDTVDYLLNGNSKLIVNTYKKYAAAGLPSPPYIVLRHERVARQYLHVYVAAALLAVFNVRYVDRRARVKGVEIEWSVPPCATLVES